jgi:hypothetical protein
LILFVFSLLSIHNTVTSEKFKIEHMTYSDKIKFLTKGDTLFTNSPKTYFYAKYKDGFDKIKRIVQSGVDSVSIAGLFVKIDSSTDRYGKSYEKFLEVKPIKEPKYDDPIIYDQQDRVGKSWFVNPNDVNVGTNVFRKESNK